MANTYTMADPERLGPQWEKVFGDTMPMGFEVGPEQVPIIERCIREKSRELLAEYVATLPAGTSY